jgi:hypothetical protein
VTEYCFKAILTFLCSAAQKSSLLDVKVYAHHNHGEEECIATHQVPLEELVSGASKGSGEGTSQALNNVDTITLVI